ncbi:hypothetical protein JCM14036_30990 [Desulfotomaculum defluvii]
MTIFGTPELEKSIPLISEERTEDGKTVRKFKNGKLNIIAVYHNKPSQKAIENFNKAYNELAHDWVERQYAKEQKERASA